MHDERDRAIEHVMRHSPSLRTGGAAGEDCVDAETLAAWASGSLRGSESAGVDSHLLQCARCQAMLATFVRTAPADGGDVARPPVPFIERWRIGWLVPLATAAAAVALWVVVPGDPVTVAPEQQVRDVAAVPAEERQSGAPAAPPAAPPSAAPKRAPAPRQESQRLETLARNQERALESKAPASLADQQAPAASAATAERVETDRGALDKTGRAEAAAPAAAGRSDRDVAGSAFRGRSTTVQILAPDPASRWRIVGGRVVERSATAGARWDAVTLPGTDELTAGSAPSTTTVWLVGRGGVVYRSTDGIAFVRVPFVGAIDLVSVSALDDRQAAVTTADGRRFRTRDAGVTWIADP